MAFAFEQCGLAFSPGSEQVDAIYAVMTGKDAKGATGFAGKLVCFIINILLCAITSTGLK